MPDTCQTLQTIRGVFLNSAHGAGTLDSEDMVITIWHLFNSGVTKSSRAADKSPLCSAGCLAVTSDSNPVDNTSTNAHLCSNRYVDLLI